MNMTEQDITDNNANTEKLITKAENTKIAAAKEL